MLSLSRSPLVACVLGFALGSALACKSTTSSKGSATGENITKAARLIEKGIAQLDATSASLTDLVTRPAADLEAQYKVFKKNLASLESTAEAVKKTSASMDANGKAYFAEWDQQIAAIQNEDIRERSAERRETVAEGLKEIQSQYAEAKDEFTPLLSDLRDIRTALDAELTMGSVKSLEDDAEDVSDATGDVKETLSDLAGNFRKLGVELSSRGPEAAAAPK